MIDFKKLNTPEAREEARVHREKREQEIELKDTMQKLMVEELYKSVEQNKITNVKQRAFIESLYYKINSGFWYLTEDQEVYLTDLYKRY